MKKIFPFFGLLLLVVSMSIQGMAQTSPEDESKAEVAFKAGNEFLKQKKYSEALDEYTKTLKVFPEDVSTLYNAGMAAFSISKFDVASMHWSKVKDLMPMDWQVRTKLIQTHQALNKTGDVTRERSELFKLKETKKVAELNNQIHFCRDQFKAGERNVMAFENFAMTGPRGIRYTFFILDDVGDIDYRISLGSYDSTNAFWQETTEPKPKKGERLFHLDGYFAGGSHATYGMYNPEPTYDATKKMVVQILDKSKKPISATVVK